MPSSISSSNDRIPAGAWGGTWLLTLLLVVGALGSWEGVLRSKGYEPSHSDSLKFWALTRAKLNPQEIALLGESRIQFGLDPATFARELNYTSARQLAVKGSSAHPIFKHLAEESDFKGLLVHSVNESFFFDKTHGTEVSQRMVLTEYAKFRALDYLEYSLRSVVQDYLVSQNNEYSLNNMLKVLPKSGWPNPDWHAVFADRSHRAYCSRNEKLGKLTVFQHDTYENLDFPPNPQELKTLLGEIEDSVKRIQDRGGRVVFVRFPSKGKIRETERQHFPRAKYWDVLASSTAALCIHAEDYPELSKYECPDESHLDAKDIPAFTESLAKIIKQKLQDGKK